MCDGRSLTFIHYNYTNQQFCGFLMHYKQETDELLYRKSHIFFW